MNKVWFGVRGVRYGEDRISEIRDLKSEIRIRISDIGYRIYLGI